MQQQTHPKVMTNILKKSVQLVREVHLSEVTSYKIHTLEGNKLTDLDVVASEGA